MSQLSNAWLASIGDIDWLINCVGYLHDQHGGPEKTITLLVYVWPA